jgi:hypothetical protein
MAPADFAALLLKHRFRVTLGACVLAHALMIVLIQTTVGLVPPWGGPASLPV